MTKSCRVGNLYGKFQKKKTQKEIIRGSILPYKKKTRVLDITSYDLAVLIVHILNNTIRILIYVYVCVYRYT